MQMPCRWNITYQEAWADEEYREDLKAKIIDQVGYFVSGEARIFGQ